jgi:hypothetical protein
LQITLFEELESIDVRSQRDGFGTAASPPSRQRGEKS